MESNPSSSKLIDISCYCSSFADEDFWSSSQSTSSRSSTQRLINQTPTCSSDSGSPILPALPLPPSDWSLTTSFANLEVDTSLSSLWPINSIPSDQDKLCNCCRCVRSEKMCPNRWRSRQSKENCSFLKNPTAIGKTSTRSNEARKHLSIFESCRETNQLKNDEIENGEIDFDNEQKGKDDTDDGTLRLHVSNIPFTWSKEKLAEIFGKYGTTFDVEVVYNERGSKGFGFVTFLAKKDALEAKRKMDREIVDGRRLVVNFAKPKQKVVSSSKDHQASSFNHFKAHWKSNERSTRQQNQSHQALGFSTPPTARRQNLAGFASLSSTPTRSTMSNQSHRNYL